jgi:hypothetical protein
MTIADSLSESIGTGIDAVETGMIRTALSARDGLSELSHRTRENIELAYERLRRGVSRQELAQLPPPRQYETEIRKEGDQILIAQLHLSVFDSLGLPLANAPVILFSTPKVSTTNDDGVATFHDVPIGDHRLEIHTPSGEVESREVIIEPPSNIDLESLEKIDATLPVMQVVVADSSLHAAAPLSMTLWLYGIITVLAVGNIAWIIMWVRKRRLS